MYMVVIKYIAKCLQIVRSCLHQNINSQKKGKQKNEHTFYIIKFTLRPFALRAPCQKKNIQSVTVQNGPDKLLHFKRPHIQVSLLFSLHQT